MRGTILAGFVSLALAAVSPATARAETVVNIGNGPDIQTLDPHLQSATTDVAISRAICEGLVSYDPFAKVVPGLAESWTVSPDGLVWTFTLRPGLKWSDGTPFTADAFVWSWRRLLTPTLGAAVPDLLYPVANAEAVFKGEKPPESLGVAAPDDRTLVVTLHQPFPDFLAYTAVERIAFPLRRDMIERHGMEWVRPGNFHCTGPFTLTELQPQSHIKVVRNPHYWDAANVRVDAINFMSTADVNTELKRFRAGELHATNTVPSAQLDWLRQNMGDSLRIVLQASTYSYMPNWTREPWKSNRNLRLALALALDRQALVEKVTRGGEQPAWTISPPNLEGYDVPVPEWASWTQERRVAEARRLLAEAGYGPDNPLKLEILYNTQERHRQIAIAAGAMWKQTLGIAVTLDNQEWKVVLERMAQKTFPDLLRRTWIASFPVDHLKLLRREAQPRVGVGYGNDEFERLMDEAGTIVDPKAYRAKLREAEALALRDMPIIPVFHDTFRRLVSPELKGFEMNYIDVHNPKYWRLEK